MNYVTTPFVNSNSNPYNPLVVHRIYFEQRNPSNVKTFPRKMFTVMEFIVYLPFFSIALLLMKSFIELYS